MILDLHLEDNSNPRTKSDWSWVPGPKNRTGPGPNILKNPDWTRPGDQDQENFENLGPGRIGRSLEDGKVHIVLLNWNIPDPWNFTAMSETLFEFIPERFHDFLGVIISSYLSVNSELRFVSFHCQKKQFSTRRSVLPQCTTNLSVLFWNTYPNKTMIACASSFILLHLVLFVLFICASFFI